MSNLKRAASIDDLRILASKRLPKFAFDFIDGGAESEINLSLNKEDFRSVKLSPRYLVDCSKVSTKTHLFGKEYFVPFGIAPIGFLNMAWPGADLMMARLAAREKMPHVVSTPSSTAVEKIAETADGFAWFQLYVSRHEDFVDKMLSRVKSSGIDVLVVTVDVPQPGKRDRDIQNQLQLPFRPTPRQILDLAMHPKWSISNLINGVPRLENFINESSMDGKTMSLSENQKRMISNDFVWDDLKRLRDKWKGKLLVKGLMHAKDAVLALEAGCDGIIVSNHGGRQVDYAPSTISALPAIVKAISGKIPILLDSGVRRGGHIACAKALGADFVFAGRAFAYGASAGGEAGVHKAFEILKSELSNTLGQIGQPNFNDVSSKNLAQSNAN